MKSFQEISVLYEDRDILVVHKPAGLSTESGQAKHPSVESLLRNPRFGYLRAVHRLDRPASGVLILAKRKTVLALLMSQFELRKVQKTYEALVTGTDIPDQGCLNHWLKRDDSGRRALAFNHPIDDAQPVELKFEVLQREHAATRLLIYPKQGRFHQVRAQLAVTGWPIVGDQTYGGTRIKEEHSIRLHARRLLFIEPVLATHTMFECDAPW